MRSFRPLGLGQLQKHIPGRRRFTCCWHVVSLFIIYSSLFCLIIICLFLFIYLVIYHVISIYLLCWFRSFFVGCRNALQLLGCWALSVFFCLGGGGGGRLQQPTAFRFFWASPCQGLDISPVAWFSLCDVWLLCVLVVFAGPGPGHTRTRIIYIYIFAYAHMCLLHMRLSAPTSYMCL